MHWQVLHDQTEPDTLKIVVDENKDDPGLTPERGQGPTPFQTAKELLSMETVLFPFQTSAGLPVSIVISK